MNRLYYTITYSDIKHKPVDHLPITIKTKFRTFTRSIKRAELLRRQNRDVILIEHNKNGIVESWELPARQIY